MIRRSLILDTTIRLVVDAAIVLSIYMLFAGHNQPGGGFVGGLVAAGAVALRYIAGGLDDVRSVVRVRPATLVSAGLVMAACVVLLPVLSGDPLMDHRLWHWHVELLGDVSLNTAAVFDSGVYLVVVGLILMILDALGEEDRAEPDGEERP